MMTSKELVQEALEFRQVPRVPYCIGFTVYARERFLASPYKDILNRLDNDVIQVPVIRIKFGTRDANGFYTDEFGVTWDRTRDSDIGVPHPILTPETLSSFKFPNPNEEGRFDELIETRKKYPDKYIIMAMDFSLYERAWSLRGMENLLTDFVDDEDFVGELLDKILAFNLAVIQEGLKQCPNLDGIYFGDDFGSQLGLIMGPSAWRKIIKPRLAKQYAAVRSAGKKVFIHSCGHVQEIFDELIEIGVNVFNPFQPEVMDVYDLMKRYHGRLAFHGGVSTQRLLPYGTVDEVKAEVKSLLEAGKRGGYIIAPAHSIPEDAKPENINAMLELILQRD
jgi:uroporphyrinogen decarboxylase